MDMLRILLNFSQMSSSRLLKVITAQKID